MVCNLTLRALKILSRKNHTGCCCVRQCREPANESNHCRAARKRQRTGALQDASRSPNVWCRAPAFWTAAALRRFSPTPSGGQTVKLPSQVAGRASQLVGKPSQTAKRPSQAENRRRNPAARRRRSSAPRRNWPDARRRWANTRRNPKFAVAGRKTVVAR
jgi:hypothetical protein